VSDDRIDELAARLFEAVRHEPAPSATRQRIAQALRSQPLPAAVQSPSWARWRYVSVTATAAAAALVAGALWWRSSSVSMDITAEALPPRASEQPAPASEPAQLLPSSLAPEVPPPQPGARVARRPATLEQELSSLQRARAALDAGHVQEALRELDRYERVLQGRQLEAEASLLRIETLARAGRSAEVAELARRFVEHNPHNPLVERARALAAASSPAEGEPP
jgi:hypothetical protein